MSGGQIQLGDDVRPRFMHLTHLELKLGQASQSLRLVPDPEKHGAEEDRELQTVQTTITLPESITLPDGATERTRVLGFKFWEVGSSGGVACRVHPRQAQSRAARLL